MPLEDDLLAGMEVHGAKRYRALEIAGRPPPPRFRPPHELVFAFMERTWLADQLAAGRSIEAIARDIGRDPSTVSYWVGKHGLVSAFAARHAARGGIARAELEALVGQGYTVERIAEQLDRGATTVRYWLKRYDLTTARTVAASPADRPPQILRSCRKHGVGIYMLTSGGRRYRCRRCRAEAVSARRRRLKLALVDEAGGACRLCGYDRYAGALQFHHLNPGEKSFAIPTTVSRDRSSGRSRRRRSVFSSARTAMRSSRPESLVFRDRLMLPTKEPRD